MGLMFTGDGCAKDVAMTATSGDQMSNQMVYLYCGLSFARALKVWDIRTKANVHTLSGHTNTVATVKCQASEPQIITGRAKTPLGCACLRLDF